MEFPVSEELTGLRKELLFGRKERLYAAPEEGEKVVKMSDAGKPRKVKEAKEQPKPKEEAVLAESFDEGFNSKTVALVSTAFELLGIASLTAGGFLVADWLGFMILGALLIVLGVATGYGP